MLSKLLRPRQRMRTFPLGKQFQSWSCKASAKPPPNDVRLRCFAPEVGSIRLLKLRQRWMMNKILMDANTLIAAFDESHADHRRARQFVESLRTFRTSPQGQGAFLRFFTRPWTDAAGARQLPRMSTGEAMGHLKAILALPQHEFLADDVPFDSVSMRSLSGFKQWNDAYLIALAAKHGLKLATLERKLENMDDTKVPVLHVIA